MTDNIKIPELDPIFVKAIKLLHSKSSDSTEQLKKLLDDAINQRRSELKLKKADWDNSQNRSKNLFKKDIHSRKRDSDTNLEKMNNDDRSIDDMPPLKKFRHHESSFSRDEKKNEKVLFDPNKMDLPELIDGMSGNGDTISNNALSSFIYDEQFDLDLDNLSCVICKDLTVTAINRLVECQECHNLYHQDCHQPKVLDDVNDPRFVWYCNKCSKNMKKILQSKPVVKKILKAGVSSEITISKPFETVQPFKRIPDANKLASSISKDLPTAASKSLASYPTKFSASSSVSELIRLKSESSKPPNKIIKLDAKSAKNDPSVKSFASQLASLTIFPVSKTTKFPSSSTLGKPLPDA